MQESRVDFFFNITFLKDWWIFYISNKQTHKGAFWFSPWKWIWFDLIYSNYFLSWWICSHGQIHLAAAQNSIFGYPSYEQINSRPDVPAVHWVHRRTSRRLSGLLQKRIWRRWSPKVSSLICVRLYSWNEIYIGEFSELRCSESFQTFSASSQDCCHLSDASNSCQKDFPLFWWTVYEGCFLYNPSPPPRNRCPVQWNGNRSVQLNSIKLSCFSIEVHTLLEWQRFQCSHW